MYLTLHSFQYFVDTHLSATKAPHLFEYDTTSWPHLSLGSFHSFYFVFLAFAHSRSVLMAGQF